MTYKQIETSREVRLWIGQVVVPVAAAVAIVLSDPERYEFILNSAKEKFKSVKDRFKKKEKIEAD